MPNEPKIDTQKIRAKLKQDLGRHAYRGGGKFMERFGDILWYFKSEANDIVRLLSRTRQSLREFLNDIMSRLRS